MFSLLFGLLLLLLLCCCCKIVVAPHPVGAPTWCCCGPVVVLLWTHPSVPLWQRTWCCCADVVVLLWSCCGVCCAWRCGADVQRCSVEVVWQLWRCWSVITVLLWCCCGVVAVLLWSCCGVVVVFFLMKAILSFFLIFGPLFCCWFSKKKNFSFHFCFDLPQVSNCYESDSFIFWFLPFFKKAFLLFLFLLFF